ncbi:MAG: hypothetical protein EG822_16530 [Deltaproteobacteria bacterium]|nr:hypothetical protein [Deltaproteobacteria bacterium]TLN00733.1 MAG: hypothetical protein FDZ73_18470 [bacterium]
MSDILNRTKSEIKQLPWMLGKLAGGIMAVVGVAGLVLIWTGKTGSLLSSLVPYVFSAVLGFLLFLYCSRAMTRSKTGSTLPVMPVHNQVRTNIIAWSLLLLIVLVFLVITYLVTR